MDINDRIKAEGHLEVIKQFSDGREEQVFEDRNVICSGLGQSIAQLMTREDCGELAPSFEFGDCPRVSLPGQLPPDYSGTMLTSSVLTNPGGMDSPGHITTASLSNDVFLQEGGYGRRLPCSIQLFILNRYQLGSGSSAVVAAPTLNLLGAPLKVSEYTNYDKFSIDERNIYSNETMLLTEQATAPVTNKGIVGDSVVHVIRLDENMCNGTTINEIGLLVDNPFYFLGDVVENFSGYTPPGMVDMDNPFGGSVFADPPRTASFPGAQLAAAQEEAEGSLLGAYRKFPEILKEQTFSLLFRWSISFKPNC